MSVGGQVSELVDFNSQAVQNSQGIGEIEKTVLDLGSSTSEVLGTFKSIYKEDGTLDQEKSLTLQTLMQERQQITNTITNLMRSLHEMVMSVVRNFRLN